VAVISEAADLTYPYEHLGSDASALAALAKGSHPFLATLKAAKKPVVAVGPGVLNRPDREALVKAVHELVEAAGVVRPDWNGYNVLHDSASRVAALDVGFLPSAAARASKAAPKFVYLLGADDYADAEVPADAFVVYQGHHGDKGAARADVVLPGAAYTEKVGSYVNFEGRVQQTRPATPLVGDARDDWKILRALSEVLGKPLPYDTPEQVQARLVEVAPHFAHANSAEAAMWLNGEYIKAIAELAKKQAAGSGVLGTTIKNFYMTDAISRASQTMARCVVAKQQVQA
jgi:NADH dehydrogenase (ubiquinone) Fe-S protein 1